MADKDINQWMAFYANGAVELAAHLNMPTLDYSIDSIKQVEELCASLYNDTPKNFISRLFKRSYSKKEMIETAKMLGAYVGEVIIKKFGGKWDYENTSIKGNAIVLTIDDIKLFPVGKVYKRLVNGPEDNVYHYFHFIAQEIGKVQISK